MSLALKMIHQNRKGCNSRCLCPQNPGTQGDRPGSRRFCLLYFLRVKAAFRSDKDPHRLSRPDIPDNLRRLFHPTLQFIRNQNHIQL